MQGTRGTRRLAVFIARVLLAAKDGLGTGRGVHHRQGRPLARPSSAFPRSHLTVVVTEPQVRAGVLGRHPLLRGRGN